jgi:hypothetical protein
LFDRHSAQYREAALNDCHFASEHAAALVLHSQSRYVEARARLAVFCGEENCTIGLSASLETECRTLIADCYWSEQNYQESARWYSSINLDRVAHTATDASGSPFAVGHIRGRLLGSLIELKRFDDVVQMGLSMLRSSHRDLTAKEKASIYRRIAVAFTKLGHFTKAAIACWKLCRLGWTSESDELAYVAWATSSWVVLQMPNSEDTLVPRASVDIPTSTVLSDPVSPELVSVWRSGRVPRTAETLNLAAVFEFVNDLNRSLTLLKIAVRSFQSADSPQDVSFPMLRMTRVQLKRGEVSEAVASYCQALATRPDSITMGQNIQVRWGLLEPCIEWKQDEDIQKFFGGAVSAYANDMSAQGWLKLHEAHSLFARLLVQAGKRTLVEALILAEKSGDHILWLFVWFAKLFRYFSEHYRNAWEWVRDVLDVATNCFGDEPATKESFGKNIQSIVTRYSSAPFGQIQSEIDRLDQHWHEHAFLVAVYAVWRTAQNNAVRNTTLDALRNRLRESAPFLTTDV